MNKYKYKLYKTSLKPTDLKLIIHKGILKTQF